MIHIANTPWHVAHQYELYKVPNTHWYHIVNTIRKWGKYRPSTTNLSRVPYYEKGKYDLAVLHVDQQCVDPSFGKSRLYKELNAVITDVPKIVINHGTPFWPEVMDSDEIIRKMKIMLAGNHVVYNSHRAKEMWEKNGKIGLSGTVIIHGLEVDEWWDLPKEPRVITTLSPAGLPRYYNRQLLADVKTKLKERGIAHVWIGNDWQSTGFDDYREFVGRSLVYFNPTLESPMPRSRTEAMLSGCCTVTLANHGAETFIEQGVNGFHVPNNPDACADLIQHLIEKEYKTCIEIGKRGKETARQLFNGKRFQDDWTKLLSTVLEKKI